ncbi:MAG: hypothetical protein H6981_01135 [Gammaproteobacteria bacterium]|nr:hypothetical protein [Gammaproteobacteria bacterium]MCP5135389.1 hypothetical protein [Gammaproteobacteria bacterium]
MRIWIKRLIPVVLLLSGCATQPPEVLSEGPTMREIYQATVGGANPEQSPEPSRPVQAGITDASARSQAASTRQGWYFKALPNPTLCTHVFAHFAGAQPVPPYDTCWKMYDSTVWARPGEVR